MFTHDVVTHDVVRVKPTASCRCGCQLAACSHLCAVLLPTTGNVPHEGAHA